MCISMLVCYRCTNNGNSNNANMNIKHVANRARRIGHQTKYNPITGIAGGSQRKRTKTHHDEGGVIRRLYSIRRKNTSLHPLITYNTIPTLTILMLLLSAHCVQLNQVHYAMNRTNYQRPHNYNNQYQAPYNTSLAVLSTSTAATVGVKASWDDVGINRSAHICDLPYAVMSKNISARPINHFGYARALMRIGEAKVPGPRAKPKPQIMPFVLEICNITHLLNNSQILKERDFDVTLVTEHSVAPNKRHKTKIKFPKPFKFHISELDREKAQHVGGTACIMNSNYKHIIQPQPKHAELKTIINQGRVGLYAIEVCLDVHVIAYLIYGWTGADCNDEAAARTDDLLTLVTTDMLQQDPGPKMIVGDLNGSLPSFVSFHEHIKEGHLFDIGACASSFGGIEKDTTCKANANAKATRRDYVIANQQAKDLINTMVVDHTPAYPVHDVIRVTFKAEAPHYTYQAVKMPTSIKSIFDEVCTNDFGDQILEDYNNNQRQKQHNNKAFTCEVTLEEDPTETPIAPTFPKRKPNCAMKIVT